MHRIQTERRIISNWPTNFPTTKIDFHEEVSNIARRKKIIKDRFFLQFEEIKKQIRILPELQQLISPLSVDELLQLEQNILREVGHEALLIWQTTEDMLNSSAMAGSPVYVLIDGHNRYGICQKHGIDFKIPLADFRNLYDVRQYTIDNQLGIKNITPEQISYLRGMKYLSAKKEKGKYASPDHKGQNVLIIPRPCQPPKNRGNALT